MRPCCSRLTDCLRAQGYDHFSVPLNAQLNAQLEVQLDHRLGSQLWLLLDRLFDAHIHTKLEVDV